MMETIEKMENVAALMPEFAFHKKALKHQMRCKTEKRMVQVLSTHML